MKPFQFIPKSPQKAPPKNREGVKLTYDERGYLAKLCRDFNSSGGFDVYMEIMSISRFPEPRPNYHLIENIEFDGKDLEIILYEDSGESKSRRAPDRPSGLPRYGIQSERSKESRADSSKPAVSGDVYTTAYEKILNHVQSYYTAKTAEDPIVSLGHISTGGGTSSGHELAAADLGYFDDLSDSKSDEGVPKIDTRLTW